MAPTSEEPDEEEDEEEDDEENETVTHTQSDGGCIALCIHPFLNN